MFDPAVVEPAVEFLAELAGRGRALELGIGTGRIALPLAQRGVPVHGIELSKAMVARLRAKPGGEDIGVTIGDFATTTVDGTFSRRLPGLQHDHEPDDAGGAGRVLPQRRRAPRARRLLRDRGRRPRAPAAAARRDHPRLPRERDAAGASTSTTSRTRVSRRITSRSSTAGLERLSVPFRYAWPAELDLMAQLAGMSAARALERLEARAVHEREPQARLGLGEARSARSSASSTSPPPATDRNVTAASDGAR